MSGAVSAPPRRGRRIAGWAGLVVAIVVIAAIGMILARPAGWEQRAPLDPESAAPDGARALARVLEEQGVRVVVARDRESARAALGDGATLVLPDSPALSDETVTTLADAAADVVLVEPRSRTLRLLLPGAELGGAADATPLVADCSAPDAQNAGEIVAGALFVAGAGMTGCFPVGEEYAVLRADDGTRTITAFDGRALLANDTIASAGNAAFALSALGANDTVVWYMPSLADADAGTAPTIGELTPRWVTPAIVLLIVAAIAAGIWRGRRFGPLVAENLPVTVRADETTRGRGRLYARARDAGHAIDELRAVSIERLARLLGLGPHAGAIEVADAAARLLSADRSSIRGILFEERPSDDRALVHLADRLRALEESVRTAVRPEGTTP